MDIRLDHLENKQMADSAQLTLSLILKDRKRTL